MKLLELLEDDARDLVIIYPGRFHPFHIGHGKVYKYLKQKYSNAKVFISTSGKTDGDRSPFTFEEKRKMMMLAGVDSSAIVQSKSPYQSPEITEMFDPDKTVVVFAVSEKDMENEPRFDFSNGVSFKKNGEPAHMQKWEGMESADTVRKHSYIATTPTFPFTIRGAEINSASQIRNMISKSDDTELSQILQDLYNVADIPQDVMDIFKRKIGNSTMNENWNEDLTSAFLIEDNTMATSILQALTESEFSPKQIKMAFGILNDPRYKDGNYDGAYATIEKIAKGLASHPSVSNALKRANESIKIDSVEEPVNEGDYANDQHEKLEYIHHVLQECGDGNMDITMVEQAIEYVEDIREQHFDADGSTKSESVTEAGVLAHGGKGQYKAVSSGGVVRIMYKGKEIASGDFDSGADGWFVSREGDKGQKFFGNAQDMVDHFAEGVMGTIGQGIDNVVVGTGKLIKKGAKAVAPHLKKAAVDGAKKMSKLGSKNTSYDMKTGKTNTTYGMANATEAYNEDDSSDLEKMQNSYKHNEDRNNHSDNILMLAQAFGSRPEIKAVEGLLTIIRRQGYTTPDQSEMMYNAIHKKYYGQLFPAENEGNEFSGELAKAKIDGKKEFKVDGKTYKVKEALTKLIDNQKMK